MLVVPAKWFGWGNVGVVLRDARRREGLELLVKTARLDVLLNSFPNPRLLQSLSPYNMVFGYVAVTAVT
jgi:hypothetical protein